MTPRQIELVQQSWAQVAPRADEAGRLFYGNLFALAPEVRSLFGGDIEAQGRKLMMMMSYAVKGLNRLDALRPGLEALGRRHVDYGVRDEHYAIVGKALIETLREALGRAFSAEVEQAWASAYAALAGAMQRPEARRAA